MSATQLLFPKVEIAVATDAGRDPAKSVNEDCARHGLTPFGHLAVVCDGMGGHSDGREAATLAVETVFRYFAVAGVRPDIPPAVRAREILRDAIAVANREVHALGAARPRARPGSTIVAALVHSLGTEVAHVGDSRCYVLRGGQARQVTRDHSMVQQLVDAGQLSREQASAHPDSNQITRALGMSAGVEVELQSSSIVHAVGDAFLLCSDGLSDVVTPADMVQLVSIHSSAHAAATALVALANSRGGPDNVTVLLVRTHENALIAGPEPSGSSLPPSSSPADSRPRLTEPMVGYVPSSHAAMSLADTVSPDGAPPRAVPSAPGSQPLIPPAPPSSHPRKRGRSVALVAGVALLGVGGAVAAVALSTAPARDAKEVAGPGLSIVLPSASLEPAQSADDIDAGTSADSGVRPRRVHNKSRKQ